MGLTNLDVTWSGMTPVSQKSGFVLLGAAIFMIILGVGCLGSNHPTLFTSGCITNTQFTNSTHSSPPSMTTIQSPEQDSGFNYSDIRIFAPDPIKTNVSYIAKIALNDEHAKELLKHGGIIDDKDGRLHSCPKGADPCYYPALVIRYGAIHFHIEVDEDTGKILRVFADVAADYPNPYTETLRLYRIQNNPDNTVSVYNDTTLIMTYNDTSFVYVRDLQNLGDGVSKFDPEKIMGD